NLAGRIIRELGADRFVIKPIGASQGRGVLPVDAKDLDAVLRRLLMTDREKEKSRIKYDEMRDLDETDPYDYWLTNEFPVFLIESCESSKPVVANGLPYDATLRMVFTLERDQGAARVVIHDGYWKLPERPIGQAADLRAAIVSHISSDH